MYNFDLKSTVQFAELCEKVMRKLQNIDVSISNEEVEDEVLFALLEYYNDRHFSPKETQVYEVIYEGVIVQLAISSISKKGAEGEKTHSEGGVSRAYDNSSNYPLALTRKIIPLAKGVGK